MNQTPGSASPSHVRYGVLGFTVGMAVLLYLDRFAISVATPVMLDELEITKSQMGIAVGAFFYAYALMQVPAGFVADRWGARVALTINVAGWSLCIGCIGLAQSLAALVLLRVLLGVTQAGAYPGAAGLLKRWIPFQNRGLANSAVSMGGRTGGLLTNTVTPALMAAVGVLFGYTTGQWRLVFGFYMLLGLGWSLAFYAWYRNTPREHPGCNIAEQTLIESSLPQTQGEPAKAAPVALPIKAMLTSRNIWVIAALNVLLNIGWIFLATWMPTYLKEVHEVPLWLAGTLTALPALAGMLGNVAGGFTTDRLVRRLGLTWGRRIPGVVSGLGAAAAYGLAFVLDDLAALVVLFAAASFLIDFGIGSGWAVYQDIGGRNVASVLGFCNMCGNFGAASFAIVIGRLADGKNWTTVFLISCAALVLVFICWLLIDPRKPLVRADEKK